MVMLHPQPSIGIRLERARVERRVQRLEHVTGVLGERRRLADSASLPLPPGLGLALTAYAGEMADAHVRLHVLGADPED